MKKYLLLILLFSFSVCSYGQVNSIVPSTAAKGTTLRTVITMAANVMQWSSSPMGINDIYLQQGSTIIYVDAFDPAINIYPGQWSQYSDSMYVDWTIPAVIPSGSYDVHVITYQGPFPQWPMDNVLTGGFIIAGAAGTIEGDYFFDYNQNGIRDGNDYSLAGQRVLINPPNIFAYTNSSGHYSALLDTGSYVVTPQIGGWTLTTPASSYNVTIPPSATGNDFGIYNATVALSQYMYSWHHPMRCNALGYTFIRHGNYSPIPVNGKITMVHSSNMPFDASIPPPDVISGDTLIWNYSLAPGQIFRVGDDYITFNNPPAGQTVWFAIYDSVYDNSSTLLGVLRDTFSFAVSCAVDPNDKLVSPQGATAQHYVPMNTQLTFTVNFQNTGNDTAFNVIIHDTLDFDLDLNTFELIGSSDPVDVQMDANGALQFRFNNILLPDSNIDEPGSHGMVIYRINPKPGLPDPTQITNTAHIVFDFNDAIVTNTSLSTLSNLQYPSASFDVSDPTICQTNCVIFNDQSVSGTSYAWTFQGGNPATSTSANPGAVCYNTTGQFDVQLIVTNALGSDTLTQTQYIDVSASPTGLNVVQVGDTLIANTGYSSYQWFFENDTIQGATGSYYIAPVSGNYGVVVGNSNGCTAGLNIPNVISAVSELIDSRSAQLYPNPTSGEFEISFSAFGKTNARVEVINQIGEVVSVKSVIITPGINRISFDESKIAAGFYSVRLITPEQTVIRQLLKSE